MENISFNPAVSCFISKVRNCYVHVLFISGYIQACLSLLLTSCYRTKNKTLWLANRTNIYFSILVIITWVSILFFTNPNVTSVLLFKENFLEARLKKIPLEAALEKTVFTLLFSLIHLSNMPASTSALEATTCGSTQPVLMKEPRGRHYNKTGWLAALPASSSEHRALV